MNVNANKIIADARKHGRKLLTEQESKKVLAAYGVPATRDKLAKDMDEATKFAREIGFPVVLKISSPDISHKTDAGGVKLGLKTEPEVEWAFDVVMENARKFAPEAKISGVLVQNMAPPGREVIVGMHRDQVFGPVVMFGLGGVFVEVLRDVSFRVASEMTRQDALGMILEIKGAPYLQQYRGMKAADLNFIADTIMNIAEIARNNSEISEIDVNPLFVYEKGGVAVDARIVLG